MEQAIDTVNLEFKDPSSENFAKACDSLTLQLSSCRSLNVDVYNLLLNIKSNFANFDDNYHHVLELLTVLVRIVPADQVLQVFEEEELLQGLNSEMCGLCCRVLSGLNKGTREMTNLLFTTSETYIVATIEERMNDICCLQSNREVVKDTMISYKSSTDLMIISRYLALCQILLEHSSEEEYDATFDIEFPDDVTFIFYKDYIVHTLLIAREKQWLWDNLCERYTDVSMYNQGATMYPILQLLTKFPSFELGLPWNDDFLKVLAPQYLLLHHKERLDIPLKPSTLAVYRNLVQDKSTFQIVQHNLSSLAIMRLPFLEMMVLLEKMSQFEHTVEYLVTLPQVMRELLDSKPTETESYELRQQTLSNLHNFQHLLNVWNFS